MKIVRFEGNNFKGLKAVEIVPDAEGNVVLIGGKNGQGKSSVLDAIYVALVGRSAAPPKPIRNGEEECRIVLDLGELVITRKFTEKEGGKITDTVKVESGDGKQRYNSPQSMLDDLLGEIGFDPFEFVQMKPDKQAATLLDMVPLPIDLEKMARLDAADYEKRRDVNRDATTLKGQIDGIPVIPDLPEKPVDRDAILAALASAADTNSAIAAEERDRADTARVARERREHGAGLRSEAERRRAEAARLIAEAEGLEKSADADDADAERLEKELAAAPPLAEPVNTEKLREELAAAEAVNAKLARMAERARLLARFEELRKESQGFTDAMAARAAARADALAKAPMPIEGLAFAVDEKGKASVLFNGVPFEQASTAEQLGASTAIAMAANPTLRVLRIKDGSLLDEDSMALLQSMATAEDYQLWIEVVASGGVAIIMEDGSVKGAEAKPPAAEEGPKKKAAPKKPEGGEKLL